MVDLTQEKIEQALVLARSGIVGVRRIATLSYTVRTVNHSHRVHLYKRGSKVSVACDCEAGRFDRVCRHAGAAIRRHLATFSKRAAAQAA
jgi:hypothetical protein